MERGLDEHVRRWAAGGRPTTYHFLDVNLEEPADVDARWLAATTAAARAIGAAWLCGDAGLWHFGARDRGHQLLLPPVLTRDSAYAVAESILCISEATKLCVLPENPPGAFYLGELYMLDYFALVAERAGCGLLPDCAHLAMFRRLRGLEPTAGLDGFPVERVVELHVAGTAEVDVDGLPLVDDAHGPEPLPDTWAIFDAVVPRARGLRAVVYECEKNTVEDGGRQLRPAASRVPGMSSHLAAQRAVVRMLFDPAFAAAARADPDRVLAAVAPALPAPPARAAHAGRGVEGVHHAGAGRDPLAGVSRGVFLQRSIPRRGRGARLHAAGVLRVAGRADHGRPAAHAGAGGRPYHRDRAGAGPPRRSGRPRRPYRRRCAAARGPIRGAGDGHGGARGRRRAGGRHARRAGGAAAGRALPVRGRAHARGGAVRRRPTSRTRCGRRRRHTVAPGGGAERRRRHPGHRRRRGFDVLREVPPAPRPTRAVLAGAVARGVSAESALKILSGLADDEIVEIH